MKLPTSFYTRRDVVNVARDLLGKYIYTDLPGGITGGYITETEAYAGITDKASHAFGNRRTPRTEVMYRKGGRAYVYLCYGIHSLFNIVTNVEDIPHAVLVRGINPTCGKDLMLKRSGKSLIDKAFANGPGKVCRILGIHWRHSGLDLSGDTIWLEDGGRKVREDKIQISPRIGIDYAEEDARLPYRFLLKKT
ncbi:MAG: DNA-3-methyladenine glycosylase [Bacteroidales bacterium]